MSPSSPVTIDNSDLPQPPALTPATPGGMSQISATPGSRRMPPGSQIRSSQVGASAASQQRFASRNPSATPSQAGGRVPSTPSTAKTPLAAGQFSTARHPSNGSSSAMKPQATPSAAALASAQKAKRAIAALCTPAHSTLTEEDEENEEDNHTPTLLRKGPRLLTSRKS